MTRVGLIIFDCDGVLVDSELIACRTVSICLNEVGINLPTNEVIKSYMGLSVNTMIDDLRMRFRARLPLNFPRVLQTRTREAFDRDLKATVGVDRVLQSMRFRVCVASSSAPERVIRSLEITGLLEYFQCNIFSATQVPRGKPAPDLFLFAANQMSVSARDCVVIEDSIPGVQAACAAGMRVFGFTGGSHCGPEHAKILHEEGAIATFKKMKELPSLLSKMTHSK
jgi:HAD superfamily hydrolase (TIGR01509 family)